MKNIFVAIKNFFNEEDGPTAVEYDILVAVIIAVVFVEAGYLGQQTSDLWANNVSKILAL